MQRIGPIEKVQQYAKEEKHLFEDLRYGLIFGSKQFVDKLRKQYLPARPQASMPQQSQMAKQLDLCRFIDQAQRILKCDVRRFIQAGRLKGTQKENRDLLVYFLWRSSRLTNEQIGRQFGLSYSAVSHAVKAFRARIRVSPDLIRKFDLLNSQFKL